MDLWRAKAQTSCASWPRSQASGSSGVQPCCFYSMILFATCRWTLDIGTLSRAGSCRAKGSCGSPAASHQPGVCILLLSCLDTRKPSHSKQWLSVPFWENGNCRMGTLGCTSYEPPNEGWGDFPGVYSGVGQRSSYSKIDVFLQVLHFSSAWSSLCSQVSHGQRATVNKNLV